MLQNFKSTEPVEEAGDVEQMEPETDPVSTASEMEGAQEDTHVKTEEPEDGTDEEVVEKKPVLCTMSQLTLLAKQIGSNWKLLAPKLGFKKDEVTSNSIPYESSDHVRPLFIEQFPKFVFGYPKTLSDAIATKSWYIIKFVVY